jgi:hypothetical protein
MPSKRVTYSASNLVKSSPYLQYLDGIYSVNRLEKWPPERNVIGLMHAKASSEQAWEPMASSSVNSCRKKNRTLALHVRLDVMVARGYWLLEREEDRTLAPACTP